MRFVGALDFDLNHAADLAVIIGAFILGAGYLLGQLRRGRDESTTNALAIAADELELLKGSRDRMSAELRDTKDTVAKLEGALEQLRRENQSLRELVMLDALPPALRTAIDTANDEMGRQHQETRDRIIAELGGIEQRLTALLGKGGNGS